MKCLNDKRDPDSIPSPFAPDPDVVIYGTGADEKGFGLAGAKADWQLAFSQSEASAMSLVGFRFQRPVW